MTTWVRHTCVRCGRTFGGAGVVAALRRFYTHPAHDCVREEIRR